MEESEMKKNAMKLGAIWLIVLLVVSVFLGIVPSNASAEFEGGSGTPEDPYQIANVEQLQNMNLYLDAHYILVDDIDASDTVNWNSGAGFEPVGTSSNRFTGTFNGDGYKITGLYVNRPSTSPVGLFGIISGNIINVGLEDVDIAGHGSVGGLAGDATFSSISNSYATGCVSGSSIVGGLVGCSNGPISNSYATGLVSGSLDVGGLVGYSQGASISNSYATGSVSGTSDIGGLVGLCEGPISNSYATGSVSGS